MAVVDLGHLVFDPGISLHHAPQFPVGLLFNTQGELMMNDSLEAKPTGSYLKLYA